MLFDESLGLWGVWAVPTGVEEIDLRVDIGSPTSVVPSEDVRGTPDLEGGDQVEQRDNE